MDNIFETTQQNEQVFFAANGKPTASAKKRNDWAREPNHRLNTPGFEEIQGGIWITDPGSKNAGACYFDISRCASNGKRYKTLRLHQDFFGVATAMTEIAGLATKDPAITQEQRARYEAYRQGVCELLTRLLLPSKVAAASKEPQSAAELLAAMFN